MLSEKWSIINAFLLNADYPTLNVSDTYLTQLFFKRNTHSFITFSKVLELLLAIKHAFLSNLIYYRSVLHEGPPATPGLLRQKSSPVVQIDDVVVVSRYMAISLSGDKFQRFSHLV